MSGAGHFSPVVFLGAGKVKAIGVGWLCLSCSQSGSWSVAVVGRGGLGPPFRLFRPYRALMFVGSGSQGDALGWFMMPFQGCKRMMRAFENAPYQGRYGFGGQLMKIVKSTRHQKIIGDFGENLVCNWLSRSGFEVVIVDHTGIDVLAYNPRTRERLGITVKSRTRHDKGKEIGSVNLLSYQKGKNDRKKMMDACKAFGAEPWLAIYVEAAAYADLIMLSLRHYDRKYRGKAGRKIDDWKMTEKAREIFEKDSHVRRIHMDFSKAGSSWEW